MKKSPELFRKFKQQQIGGITSMNNHMGAGMMIHYRQISALITIMMRCNNQGWCISCQLCFMLSLIRLDFLQVHNIKK